MKRSHLIQLISLFCVLLYSTAFDSVAAPKSSFSGKVVDEKGNPVSDFNVVLAPLDLLELPHLKIDQELDHILLSDDTDKIGAFSIKNIDRTLFSVSQDIFKERRDYEMLSVKIGGMTFHIDRYALFRFDGFPISIAPGSDIKDIEIKVKLRMWIRGQVLSADGTPLRNTRVELTVKDGGGHSSGTTNLDAEGRFVHYLNRAGNFTVIVKHQGQQVQSKPIRIRKGEQFEGLILKFATDAPGAGVKPRVVLEKPKFPPQGFMENYRKSQSEGVWVINPENRHAYKRIKCASLAEAQAMAKEQGAHLVSINDEAEQHWLLQVFRDNNFWTGLRAGATHWDTGEPLTYTNWETPPESDKDNEAHIVLLDKTRKWEPAHQGSPTALITEHAILEKANLIIGAPSPDDEER